jgi:hypothetical protein
MTISIGMKVTARSDFVRRSSTSEGGSDEAIHTFFLVALWNIRGACHRARLRATRWLAMTTTIGFG